MDRELYIVYVLTFMRLNFCSLGVSHFYFCGCRVSGRIAKALCTVLQSETFTDGC